jgi:hypothetical protein
VSAERAARPIEQLCTLTPTIRTDLRVERGIEIARECLAGDPFRLVPDLYSEAGALFDGEPASSARALRRSLHAFAVAALALQAAKSALMTRDVLGDC